MLAWAHAMEELRQSGRFIVKQEEIGENSISTVFLGLDHNFTRRAYGVGHPHIFETMAFGPPNEDGGIWLGDRFVKITLGESFYQDRYSTWNEALEGHEQVAQWMKLSANTPATKEESSE
jgi:hypothetical protein